MPMVAILFDKKEIVLGWEKGAPKITQDNIAMMYNCVFSVLEDCWRVRMVEE